MPQEEINERAGNGGWSKWKSGVTGNKFEGGGWTLRCSKKICACVFYK